MRPRFPDLHGALLGALTASAFGFACSAADAPGGTPAQSEQASATPASAGPGGRAADSSLCPTAVPGTTVRATDTEGGAALELTTTGDVAAVRARSRKLAEHHGMTGDQPSAGGHGPGRAPGQAMGGHAMDGQAMGGHAMGGHAMDDAEVRVQDIEGGVRIELTPRVPTGLEAVRTHANHLAQRLGAGDCAAAMTMMM
jgi:hypothetical protein